MKQRKVEGGGVFKSSYSCSCFCATVCTHIRRSLRVLMFPSCVQPPNNISFKSNSKNPSSSLPPWLNPLCFSPPQKTLITRQHSVIKTCVSCVLIILCNSFLYGSGSRNGGKKQTCELGVNHVKQRATIVHFHPCPPKVCTFGESQKLLTRLLFSMFFTTLQQKPCDMV